MAESQHDQPEGAPNIRPISAPMAVPVFNVVVYVSRVNGQVQACVANLPDLSFTAANELLALKQAITQAKQRLTQWHAAGEEIPWIDPVPAPSADQQQRLVPVHL